MATADPERARFEMLSEMALSPDVTEEQLEDLERLQEAHPDWVAASVVLHEPEPAPIPRRPEIFTAAELEQIAASQNCDLTTLKHRLIIQKANGYYVIGPEGEYGTMKIKAELDVSLPRDLARVPSASPPGSGQIVPDGRIVWDKKKGDSTEPKTVDDLRKDYCTVASKIVASMSIRHSYYDPEKEIFYERVCPMRRDIVPREDPEIDEWLTLLGGKNSEKLKDWVAVAPVLDKPVCSIYVDGPKDAGKTMLAAGVSRIWSEAPTEFESAHGAFNSAITDNPLIFADEELPYRMTSGFLRKFIGQGTHPLRRKNMPEAKLLGYFRLIIAANNPDLLQFEDEHFSRNDIEAIAARILYIKCDRAASEYLRSRGGYKWTKDWVSGDRIAAHALWLHKTREVVPGSRFLVQGEVTDVHRLIATHGSVRGLVIEWVCKALLKKWVLSTGPLGIQFGGGRIYVNTSFVKDTWDDVLDDDRVPSLSKIGRALKPLTIPDPDGKSERRLPISDGRADFYSIDPQHVYDASKRLQIATEETFKKLIEAKRAYVDLVDAPDSAPSPPPGAAPVHDASWGLFAIKPQ